MVTAMSSAASSASASRSAAEQDEDELVTVVVPARNEERFLGATLSSLSRQDYRNLQILVVDGASTDGTADVVSRHMAEDPRIEVVHNERRTIPAALNLGLSRARGRWLVRMDAHSTVDPGYVSAAVTRLREGTWGGVGGRKDGTGTTPAGRAIAAALHSRFGVGGSVYHHGVTEQQVDHIAFGAYPTELVRALNGWDERLVANEDFEFDHRLRRSGAPLLFDPRLRIQWQSKQTLRELYLQYRRYGRGKVDVVRLHPSSLRARHLMPPLLVPYLLVAAAVGLRDRRLAGAMLLPYVVGVTSASLAEGPSVGDARASTLVPAALVTMHVGWGIGVWSRTIELLVGR